MDHMLSGFNIAKRQSSRANKGATRKIHNPLPTMRLPTLSFRRFEQGSATGIRCPQIRFAGCKDKSVGLTKGCCIGTHYVLRYFYCMQVWRRKPEQL